MLAVELVIDLSSMSTWASKRNWIQFNLNFNINKLGYIRRGIIKTIRRMTLYINYSKFILTIIEIVVVQKDYTYLWSR